MSNSFLNLVSPAANGAGTPLDVSAMGATKTIVLGGNNSSTEPFVAIEISNDPAGAVWTTLDQFTAPGLKTIQAACYWMRTNISNYRGGGAPVCSVAADDSGATFTELVAPAGNGDGADVDTSTMPSLKTIQVAGSFNGACIIEASTDGGTEFAQVAVFYAPGVRTLMLTADAMRVSRSGATTGTPVVHVGAATAGGGGGATTGAYLGRQTLTAAAGVYTPNPSAIGGRIVMRMCAAGGGGGGSANPAANQHALAGGGGAGEYLEIEITNLATGGAYNIGAGGVGVSANAGTAGGDTDILINGVTYVCAGGSGGAAAASSAAAGITVPGGASGGGGSAAPVKWQQAGLPGFVVQTSAAQVWGSAGAGGSTPLGSGGNPRMSDAAGNITSGAGANGSGPGAGGAGSASRNGGGAFAGGDGFRGQIVIDEYSA